jgi:hypothetical protein
MAASTPKITPANPRPTRPVSYPGAALLADPDTAKSALTKSEHHHQLLKGVAAKEIADMAQARSAVSPPIRAGPAMSKPPVAYSIPEAARAAAIGTTKLRNEIRAGRLACRKIGKRSVITAQDLEGWAAALPSIHDVAPDTAATALKNFRKSA